MNNDLKERAGVEAKRRYREALQAFAVEELVWDVGCNVAPHTRAAILAEFRRRGINYAEAARVHGRGRCRGPQPFQEDDRC